MATLSMIIGTVTLVFTTLIFEYSHIWFILDIIGIVLGYVSYKRGDKNGKAGMILCAIAAVLSLGMVAIIYFFQKQMAN
ncbi:MAG: hypothetical protein IJI46_09575 [Erysipelotrichaceae bacterium]|nr:hypothetical protein [Erysipelotrichaceae bacterium]